VSENWLGINFCAVAGVQTVCNQYVWLRGE
jgi:hypothetical protein